MRWIPLVLAAALAVGCIHDGDSIPDDEFVWLERQEWAPPDPTPAECAVFTAELRIIDTMQQAETNFVQGENILFELRITNTSNVTHTLTTGGGPQVSFQVVDAQNRIIAGSTLRHAWPAALVDYPYGPGETNVHQWVWDQKMDNNEPAPPAAYTLFADERTQCRGVLSMSERIFII